MDKPKNLLIVLFAVLVLALASYITIAYYTKAQPRGANYPVRIGITLTGDAIPAIIAVQKGFFKDEGLIPTIKEYPYGAISFQNLLEGHVDLVMLAETPLIIQSFKRSDFVVIANISSTYQSRKIIGLTAKGIRSIHDLDGKKIGVLKNTSAHYFLEELLLENNIPLSDIQFVFIQDNESPDALRDGRVDAIAAFEPYPEIIQTQWPAGALWVNDGNGRIRTAFSYVMRKDYVASNREIAKRTIRATVKAINWMNGHEQEAILISASVLKIDPVIMKKLYQQYRFGVGIDEAFLLGMRQQAQWYQSRNPGIKDLKIPDYVDFVNASPLSEVLPGSVHYAH